MTTLKDVAKRAGVSAKTVSRVVNRDPLVSDETRRSVQKLVDELGYVPNDAARFMRTQTSRTVGFLTDLIATTPHSVDIVRGVQAELREEGRTLLIANSDGAADLEDEYWRLFQSQRAAGAIYATMFHREVKLGDIAFDGPLVLVNCFDAKNRFPSVLPDDVGGGALQAGHLLELGHRHIGFVTLNTLIRAEQLRRKGYEKAFKAHGLKLDGAPMVPGIVGHVGGERLVAYEAALDMLKGKNRPTAIVCGHDQIALQVMAAASALGLKVPSDLSVIGFDDQHQITEALRPALTTVALPYFAMGQTATRLLNDILASRPVQRASTLIACPLVERQSCQRLNR